MAEDKGNGRRGEGERREGNKICVRIHSLKVGYYQYQTYPGILETFASDRRQSTVANVSTALLYCPYCKLKSLYASYVQVHAAFAVCVHTCCACM